MAVRQGHEGEGPHVLDMDDVVLGLGDGAAHRLPHPQGFDRHRLQRVGPVGEMAQRREPVSDPRPVLRDRDDVDLVARLHGAQEKPGANRDR